MKETEIQDMLGTFATVINDAEKVMQAHKNLSVAYVAVRLENLRRTIDDQFEAHRRYVDGTKAEQEKLRQKNEELTNRLDAASEVVQDMKVRLGSLEDKIKNMDQVNV